MKIYDIKTNLLYQARCHTCGIREGALCSDMADDEFSRFSLLVEDIRYPAGSVLFRQGSEGLHIFSIRQGMVKLTRLRPNGDQRIMRILRPGDVGGLEAVITKDYEYDAVALDAVLACRIPVYAIQQMDVESPQLHKKLLQQWHSTLHEADEWMAELTAGTARSRLARLLLKMRNPIHPEFSTLFSREDIGSMLCMKMETASRTISAFQREGKIAPLDAGGRYYRVDSIALQAESMNEV
jgi:CRP/FNR family transcriptional regulator